MMSLLSVGLLLVLLALVVCTTLVFKNRAYAIRKDIARLDLAIMEERNVNMALEADKALEYNSIRIKTLADKYLQTRFTSSAQLSTISELNRSNEQYVTAA